MNKNTKWTTQTIRAGLEKFYNDFKHYPTSLEIDKCEYLPSSRQIQRRYGGLDELRKILGYSETHFGTGDHRSQIGKQINELSKNTENALYKILTDKFGEVFVHVEKPYSNSSKQRLDFYIYTPSGNFAVDVFYPKHLHSMVGVINIKQQSYIDYKGKLILVVANPQISQGEIDRLIKEKTKPISGNINVKTIIQFQEFIQNQSTYRIVGEGLTNIS
jgi:hypothetical protein